WSSKAALVADVLAIHIPPARDVDTGSLLSDLRAFLDDLAAAWAQPWANGIAGFLADVRSDPHAEEKLRAMSVNRSQPLVTAVARSARCRNRRCSATCWKAPCCTGACSPASRSLRRTST